MIDSTLLRVTMSMRSLRDVCHVRLSAGVDAHATAATTMALTIIFACDKNQD